MAKHNKETDPLISVGLRKSTLRALAKLGKFNESYNDVIMRLVREHTEV